MKANSNGRQRHELARGSVPVACAFALVLGAQAGCSDKQGGDTDSGGGSGDTGGTTATGGSGGTTATGGTSATGGASGTTATGGSGGTAGGPGGKSTAAEIARKLGRTNFLIGMGNDLNNDHNQDGAYTLGTTLDVHYAYLVGLPGEGGWPDWNAGGTFVNLLSDIADAHGVVPMYDLYAMTARGEANTAALADAGFMRPYWEGVKLLFQRLGVFDKPAIVHIEPDFWAYAQQQSNGNPSSLTVRISGLATECAGQPENMVGFGNCLVALCRMYSPKTLIGFHASRWAGGPADIVAFLNAVGAGQSDFIGIDMLDRDAGCFEAHTDPSCQRNDGPWYWDESNVNTPNYHQFLDYSKQIGDGLGKPVLWWQIPFGVPSSTPGGTADHYRDNRVHYIFGHVDEFVAAGGLGAVFGVGAGNQTFITTDGNQFRDAVAGYFAAPTPLP